MRAHLLANDKKNKNYFSASFNFTPQNSTNTLTTSHCRLNSILISSANNNCARNRIYKYIYLWLFAELKSSVQFSRGYDITIYSCNTQPSSRFTGFGFLIRSFVRPRSEWEQTPFQRFEWNELSFFHRKNDQIQFHFICNRYSESNFVWVLSFSDYCTSCFLSFLFWILLDKSQNILICYNCRRKRKVQQKIEVFVRLFRLIGKWCFTGAIGLHITWINAEFSNPEKFYFFRTEFCEKSLLCAASTRAVVVRRKLIILFFKNTHQKCWSNQQK